MQNVDKDHAIADRKGYLEKLKEEFFGLQKVVMKELEADEVNAKRIERLIHAQSDVYQKLLQETRALSGDSVYLR